MLKGIITDESINDQSNSCTTVGCVLTIAELQDQHLEDMTNLRLKAPTPTSFTLMGQDGINKTTGPSVTHIVCTVCVCVLVGLVGAIVYMEVFMKPAY